MILLHGLGGARDLPVPVPMAIAAGTAAVAVTFVILALAWRSPRFEGAKAPLGVRRSAIAVFESVVWDRAMAAAGLAIFGWCGWALLAGADSNANPVFGTFYVLVWVGVLPLSLLFGRVAHALSPWRTLARLRSWIMRVPPDRGLLEYPEWLGYWPASIGLFAFVWQELVSTDQVTLSAVQLWLGIYAVLMIGGTVLFGVQWLDWADPFQVYSDLVAHLSPWGRDAEGNLVVRSPMSNLATLRPAPGLVATLAVLFGSTVYDSAKDSPAWTKFVAGLSIGPVTVGTVALLGSWAIVALTYYVAARVNGPITVLSRDLPGLLAPSLLPIIAGYMTAHYLSYFVYQGQITLQQLSDPLSTGANYLGTGNLAPNLWLMTHPTFLASLKVVVIVIGHIVGAIAAHDRTVGLVVSTSTQTQARTSAGVPMAILMLLYTSTGLMLLFGT